MGVTLGKDLSAGSGLIGTESRAARGGETVSLSRSAILRLRFSKFGVVRVLCWMRGGQLRMQILRFRAPESSVLIGACVYCAVWDRQCELNILARSTRMGRRWIRGRDYTRLYFSVVCRVPSPSNTPYYTPRFCSASLRPSSVPVHDPSPTI